MLFVATILQVVLMKRRLRVNSMADMKQDVVGTGTEEMVPLAKEDKMEMV